MAAPWSHHAGLTAQRIYIFYEEIVGHMCNTKLWRQLHIEEKHVRITYLPFVFWYLFWLLCNRSVYLLNGGATCFSVDGLVAVVQPPQLLCLIIIPLKFVHKGSINTIPAMVQIMACRLDGAKPLSETMMVRLPTHICVARPQCVKYVDFNSNRLQNANPLTNAASTKTQGSFCVCDQLWETLQYNIISRWLGAYTVYSLNDLQ